MLMDDFLPLLRRRFGLDPPAVMDWSMGGYGALLAAERHPRRFRAVAVSSPAIWPTHAQQASAVPDAFDGAADFARNDVFAGAGRFTAGCHDQDFWRRMLPAQVRFVGRVLAG
jgi:pimeloyl-ACP methyl ester carboxylesterase